MSTNLARTLSTGQSGERERPFTAMIVSHRPVFALGLQRVLCRMARLTVTGTPADLCEAIEIARPRSPDLIVFDAEGDWAIKGLQALRRQGSRFVCVIRRTTRRTRRLAMHADAMVTDTIDAADLTRIIRGLLPERSEGGGARLLTRRELEVVRLVARGERRPEIARRLFISQNTVKTHMMHIRHKLGLTRRVQIANWWKTVSEGPEE